MRKALIIILIVVAIAAIVYAVYQQTKTAAPTGIRSERATIGDLRLTASASGTVTAELQVEIKSRASGTVIEVAVEPGDFVHAGDLLARLDPVDENRKLQNAEAAAISARARLAQSESQLATSQSDAADARARAERRTAAYAAGLISLEEERTARTAAESAGRAVLQRQADIRSARAALDQANLAIADAQQRLTETIIRAPSDGTMLAVNIEPGSTVSSGITNVGGGTAIMTLADLSKLFVAVQLDEAQIGAVKAGQRARIRVDAYPQQPFKGKVDRITPLGVATSSVVTFDVKVAVTDDSAALLLPGMSADVEIITEILSDQLLIPVAGLRSERGEKFVLLADKEQTRRVVTTGATDGISIVILTGLQEGDAVITAGVNTQPAAAAAQPAVRNPLSGGRGGR